MRKVVFMQQGLRQNWPDVPVSYSIGLDLLCLCLVALLSASPATRQVGPSVQRVGYNAAEHPAYWASSTPVYFVVPLWRFSIMLTF